MTDYLTESTRDDIMTDERKSKATVFYSRRHDESGRFCTVAVDRESGRVVGHSLACHSLACYGRLIDASRKGRK